MNRRHFMIQTAAMTAASLPAKEARSGLIDCNIHLGPHPHRSLPEIDNDYLAARGVDEAWAGSFEALLHRDLAQVNARLARRCAATPRLRPAGCVNPVLPAWEDDLKRCAEVHGMRILRLYPNHHGYTLTDASFTRLLEAATEQKMLVQIVAQLEDQRTQTPLMQLPPVDLKPLAGILKPRPEARVMVLNANAAMINTALRGCPGAWLDIAMIEGVGGVENLLDLWPPDKLCFGSHAPFFYWEAAVLKLQESVLDEAVLQAVRRGNAEAQLPT
jgi:predicted TIM-barrel fold metal-dependent hydrolase